MNTTLRLAGVVVLTVLVAGCAGLTPNAGPGAGGLSLARHGEARVKIVVDTPNSTPEELQAARELADYLGRITGATFALTEEKDTPPGTPAIYVGNTAFADAAGIHARSMAAQSGRIKTHAGSLILAGGRPEGTLYTLYCFLEQYAGCRWYTVFDEVVPARPALSVPRLDVTWSPAFKHRFIYRQGNYQRGRYGGEAEFFRRNRAHTESVGTPPKANMCHTYGNYFNPKDYFKEHPEYASFVDGKYSLELRDQFCQTNPEVRQIVLAKLREVIRQSPGKDYYEMSANDGNRGRCQCATCLALEKREGMTGPFMDFVNFLADGIRDEFPEAMLRTFAYNVTSEPTKTMTYRPNVALRICIAGAEHLPFTAPENQFALQALKDWRARAAHLVKWDYDGLAHGQAFPAPILDAYVDRFRLYPKLNVEALFLESEYLVTPRPFIELRHWVWLKLAEDPSREVWALVEDFCAGMYGQAAPSMVELLRTLEARKLDYPYSLYDFAFLTQAQTLMAKADAAVAADPKARPRVAEVRFSVDLATLYYWTKALTDHCRAGGRETDWPFDRETLIQRVESHLAALQAEGRWLSAVGAVTPAQRRQVEARWLEYMQSTVVEPIVRCGRAAKSVMPLPPELTGIAADRIVDLPVPVLGFCDGRGPFYAKADEHLPVADAESASGCAVFIGAEAMKPFGGVLPFAMGVYDATGRVGGGGRVNAADIAGPGYRLYRLGRFRLNPTAYIFLTGSWGIQVRPLIPFLRGTAPDQPWDVYVSFRTSGPNLPHGDATGPDGVYLDRLLLVKATPTP